MERTGRKDRPAGVRSEGASEGEGRLSRNSGKGGGRRRRHGRPRAGRAVLLLDDVVVFAMPIITFQAAGQ